LNSIIEEIHHYIYLREERSVKSVFFGGGTPSIFHPDEIQVILSTIHSVFNVDENAEITFESNPGTIDEDKLREIKKLGINRLSVGVQSFDDDELKFLTRIHDRMTALNTINLAAESGFDNINIDLIFNLPGQTKAVWETNLNQAVELPVTHISAYSLILERGTILNKMVLDGKVKMSDSGFDADLYEHTIDFLDRNNFLQYEVSNFARPGFKCSHNLVYWQHKEYLGLGPSAHSFINNRRWWNYSSLKMYIEQVNKEGRGVVSEEKLSKVELAEEYIMLHLRSEGLDLNSLNKLYGNEWMQLNKAYLDMLIKERFLSYSNNFIKFTKRGYSICDEILAKFRTASQEHNH
jgi:oxygen-independent coproporphyrinogen-3 oxidase